MSFWSRRSGPWRCKGAITLFQDGTCAYEFSGSDGITSRGEVPSAEALGQAVAGLVSSVAARQREGHGLPGE